MPAAMLAGFSEPIFCHRRHFSPLSIESVQYRHTRSTLRDNRFCEHRWDNYPISVSASNLGVFVRDSNAAVTVTLPTRKPTDTLRR